MRCAVAQVLPFAHFASSTSKHHQRGKPDENVNRPFKPADAPEDFTYEIPAKETDKSPVDSSDK